MPRARRPGEATAAVTKLIGTTARCSRSFRPAPAWRISLQVRRQRTRSGASGTVQGAAQVAVTQEEKLLALIKGRRQDGVAKQAAATWNDGCQPAHPYRQKL